VEKKSKSCSLTKRTTDSATENKKKVAACKSKVIYYRTDYKL
jgi:hypothetical protein